MKSKADKHREAGTLEAFRARQAASRAGTARYLERLRQEALNADPVCPTCGSDRNERDELIKAEREIERLRGLLAEKEVRAYADAMDTVAIEFAHRLAMNMECLVLECPASSRFYDESIKTLGEYRSAMNAIHEQHSPTYMGEPVFEKSWMERERKEREARNAEKQHGTG